MTLLKTIIRDVFYISKITNVAKKKITLLSVVIMSQITAFSDVAIIVLFATVFTGDTGEVLYNLHAKHDSKKNGNECN